MRAMYSDLAARARAEQLEYERFLEALQASGIGRETPEMIAVQACAEAWGYRVAAPARPTEPEPSPDPPPGGGKVLPFTRKAA